jgi:putative ABC transport system permease protein
MLIRRPWGESFGVPYTDFEAWRRRATTFEGIAYFVQHPVTFRDHSGRMTDMPSTRMTANTFGLLGVQPRLGRDFLPTDEAPGAPSVAIISAQLWDTRFEMRADVIGTTAWVDGAPVTIVGVMPRAFALVYDQDLWMPLTEPTAGDLGFVFARLRNGATVEQAHTELATINRELQLADLSRDRRVAPSVTTYSAFVGDNASMIYGSMWAAACCVLLIACANVANLTLVRTVGRWRDFATRIALGAPPARIVRQLLVESTVVASAAGLFAWWVATWAVHAWAITTATRYLVLDYSMDHTVLIYLAATTLGAAILCALAPVARVVQSGRALTSESRGITRDRRGKRLAAILVAGQLAVSMMLLSGAGVLVHSLLNIVGAATGVHDPDRVLVGAVSLSRVRFADGASRKAYFDRLSSRLRTIPGVEEVSLTNTLPGIGGGDVRPVELQDRVPVPGATESVQFLAAGSRYFTLTVGASAIAGRDFNDRDTADALPVAIVNQRFAATFWPGEQPVGKRLRTTDGAAPGPWRTVVAIVPNVMQGDVVRQQFKPLVYVPVGQDGRMRGMTRAGCCFLGANFLLRTRVPATALTSAVRASVASLDPDATVEEVMPLRATLAFDRDLMDLAHAELGKHAGVAPIFAAIALILAAVGLYAVIAHAVSQRTKEIGLRMAIGASTRDIWWLVVDEGLRPVAVGLLAGLAGSLVVNRLLQSQLVAVSPYDLVTFLVVPALLMLTALLACHLPTTRALRIEPAIALRHD